MVTPKLIIAGFAVLRSLHVIDGGALAAGLIGGVAAAVLATSTAGANELASILLMLTVFASVFCLIAGLVTMVRLRRLIRSVEVTTVSRMPLALGWMVGRTLVTLGLLGTSVLAASWIVRWVGPDGLLGVVVAIVLAILLFVGLRRLLRSEIVQRASATSADRLLGAPSATDDIIERKP